MYIKSFKAKNIRCFSNITLNFQASRDKDSDRLLNWNVILGNNSDGKSTLLQAIAACLMDKVTVQAIWKPEERDLVRLGAPEKYGSLQALIVREEPADGQDGASKKNQREWNIHYLLMGERTEILEPTHDLKPYVSDDFKGEDDDPVFANLLKDMDYLNRNAFGKKEKFGWISCGYGPFRRLQGISTDAITKDLFKRRFYTLYNEGAALYECEEWLKDLEYKALKEKKGSSKRKTFEDVKNLIKKLLPKVDEILIKEEVKFVRGENVFNLNQLSDGYRSMFALAVDLLSWLELMRRDKTKPINETPAVVLIDEIDSHLHPIWQREVGFWLTELFPNIQFIVTTHSAFVAMAAGKGALTILERNEDGTVIANQDVPFARGWAVDKVFSDLLGMDNLRDPETEQMLKDYDDLKIASLRRKLKPDEAKRFEDLRTRLEERLKDADQTLGERELDEDLKYFASLGKK